MNVSKDNLNQETNVTLSAAEIAALMATFGNQSRAQLEEHLKEDFNDDVASHFVERDAEVGFMRMLSGTDPSNKLYGKLVGALQEATK